MRRNEVGKNILDLLENIGSILHPSISDMWGKTIPKILAFLTGTYLFPFYFLFKSLLQFAYYFSNFFFNLPIIFSFNFMTDSVCLANKDNWNQTTWEDLVLRLLSETVKVIADDAWVLKVGEALVEQFPLYRRDPELKKSAYKHLGIILQLVSHKEFIRNKLDAMFNDCNHGDEKERQGCSQAFGYASHNHLDIVLEKLSVHGGANKRTQTPS